MKILKVNTHFFEIEELACKILGLDYDKIDEDTQVIDDVMIEKLNIDLDYFQEIISRLLPLIHVEFSGLTNQRFKGFADVKNKTWLIKTEIN